MMKGKEGGPQQHVIVRSLHCLESRIYSVFVLCLRDAMLSSAHPVISSDGWNE